MKKNLLRKVCAFTLMIALICSVMIFTGGREAYADYSMCPTCAGVGSKSITIFQTQTIGFNPVTGMPQTIQVPVTSTSPCTTCGGTGRIWIPSSSSSSTTSSSSSSTSSSESSSTSSSSSSSSESSSNDTASVKNGTVIDATDGIGDYEDAPNLLDGKTDTKFNVLATSMYIIWKAPKMIKVSGYSITTANDTATYTGRNPKTWTLYGSNKKLSKNSKSWKKIHSVTNDKKLKPVNYKKYSYKLNKAAKPYRYFKLEITKNKGADCTQLSEFTLKGKAVTVAKTSISSAKKTGTKLKLKWKKVSGATGYQIQYSTSAKFKSVNKVEVNGASKTSKTINKLKEGKTYYVRVRAFKNVNGGTVYSAWTPKTKSN